MDRTAVARMIDHTLLAPEATPARVLALCEEAVALGVRAVCVSPSLVPVAAGALTGSTIDVAAVVGFPSGAHRADVKASEAAAAAQDGAVELDMVAPLGAVFDGDWETVRAHLAAVRAAAPRPLILKVIVESALLDHQLLDRVCVKASGGIRDAATAMAMIEAGATRIGASASAAILDGLEALDAPGL